MKCQEHGVQRTTCAGWKHYETAERSEVQRLEAENARLREEREAALEVASELTMQLKECREGWDGYVELERLHVQRDTLLAALRAVLPVAEVSYEGDPWFWDPEGDSEPTAYERFEQAHTAISEVEGEK